LLLGLRASKKQHVVPTYIWRSPPPPLFFFSLKIK
jgi:hypothetical protein